MCRDSKVAEVAGVDGCIRVVRWVEEVLAEKPEAIQGGLERVCDHQVNGRGSWPWNRCRDRSRWFGEYIPEPRWGSSGSSGLCGRRHRCCGCICRTS